MTVMVVVKMNYLFDQTWCQSGCGRQVWDNSTYLGLQVVNFGKAHKQYTPIRFIQHSPYLSVSLLLMLFAQSRGGHTDVVMALLEAGAQVSLSLSAFCQL